MLTADIKNLLQSSPLIITIGNDLRGDDGVGPYIFNECQIKNVKCQMINAGERPEKLVGEKMDPRPAKIIIIDAADFGGNPGEIRLIDKDNIPEKTLSTHTFSLKVVSKLLEEDTKAPVYFIGIQPKSIELGKEMSTEVKKSADIIITTLRDLET